MGNLVCALMHWIKLRSVCTVEFAEELVGSFSKISGVDDEFFSDVFELICLDLACVKGFNINGDHNALAACFFGSSVRVFVSDLVSWR